jgi:transposase-like protein
MPPDTQIVYHPRKRELDQKSSIWQSPPGRSNVVTRKVGPVLPTILGKPVIPATVSHIDKQLDQSVQAYHQRGLSDYYQILVLDGIVIRRKTELGSRGGPAGGPGYRNRLPADS